MPAKSNCMSPISASRRPVKPPGGYFPHCYDPIADAYGVTCASLRLIPQAAFFVLLGADPAAVLRFVRAWDEQTLGLGPLRQQLQELWAERLADAEAVQEFLQADAILAPTCPTEPDNKSGEAAAPIVSLTPCNPLLVKR